MRAIPIALNEVPAPRSALGQRSLKLDRVVQINDFSQARGGATVLALAATEWLRESGLEVTFIAGDQGGNARLAELNVELVPIGGRPLLAGGKLSSAVNGMYNRDARNTLSDWIARHDTDRTIYHVHSFSQILSPSIFVALRAVSDRVIVSAHDFFWVCPNGAYANYSTSSMCDLTPLSARCIATNCDRRSYMHKIWRVARQQVLREIVDVPNSGIRILAIHDKMVPLLERGGVPRSAIEVLRNPAVPFSPTRVEVESNREILYVGRLDAEKGPDLAAAATRSLGLTLRMVGDGPLRHSLERDYPHVKIEGWRQRDEIAAFAKHARMLIMPSRYPEPFGLVAVEALWSGIPVVAAADAFLASEIVALGAGRACDPNDTVAMQETIHELAGSDSLISEMSRKAFGSSASLATTPQRWTESLTSAYHRLVHAQPADGYED
jgi:glycosyltransferase involved in cell wall biosynthesis